MLVQNLVNITRIATVSRSLTIFNVNRSCYHRNKCLLNTGDAVFDQRVVLTVHFDDFTAL